MHDPAEPNEPEEARKDEMKQGRQHSSLDQLSQARNEKAGSAAMTLPDEP
jgi:hypothetical protein